jgi:hypothetical protein
MEGSAEMRSRFLIDHKTVTSQAKILTHWS